LASLSNFEKNNFFEKFDRDLVTPWGQRSRVEKKLPHG